MKKILNRELIAGTIEKIEIFQKLSLKTLALLKESSYILEVQRKKILFLEDNYSQIIYYLLEGKTISYTINSDGRRRVLAIIPPQTFLNEGAVFGESSISTCETFEDSKILAIPLETIDKLLKDSCEFSNILLRTSNKKLRYFIKEYYQSSFITIEKYLAKMLANYSEFYGEQNGEWSVLKIPLTITLMAEIIGTNRETISRIIHKFKKLGFLSGEVTLNINNKLLRDFIEK